MTYRLLTRAARAVLLASLASALAMPVVAQGWVRLLKGTVAESFDDEDLRLFLEASRKALNDAAENEVVAWSNPSTQSAGDLTVVRSFRTGEQACRELRVRSRAGTLRSEHLVNLCRVDGRWRAQAPPRASRPGS